MRNLKFFTYKKIAKEKNLEVYCCNIKIKEFLLLLKLLLFLFFFLLKDEENTLEGTVKCYSKSEGLLYLSFFPQYDVSQNFKVINKNKKGECLKWWNRHGVIIITNHYDNSPFIFFKEVYKNFQSAYMSIRGCVELSGYRGKKAHPKKGKNFRILYEKKKWERNERKKTNGDNKDKHDDENAGDDTDDDINKNQLPTASNAVSEGIVFFCFIFISATMLQFILSKIHSLSIPVSVIWFLYGMITYVIAKNFNMFEENTLHKSIINARNIDSSVLYFVLLPILLYEATQDINYYAFKNFLYGGIGLAVIGVALQVGILGIMFYYSFMYRQEQSPLSSSFLLASILSSTDPVAVLSILSVVDAPSKISSMFHVESLINDGSSVLLFQFFFYLTIGYKANASQYLILFVKLLFLSPVFGIGMATLTFGWINLYRKYYYNQCLATLTMCYLCYFVSEYYFNLSGPLAIVCYGLFINAYGHIALDEVAQRKHKEIVELLSLMGNSSIFIISGIVSFGMMENVFKDNLYFFLYIVLTYVYLVFARSIMILLFTPFLSKIGHPINWKEILLLIWGGLRGGIVLVLGLRIEAENKINDKLTKELAYYISGSVLLILTIQGLTFECLYKFLNIYPPNPFRIVYLEKVLKMIDYNFYIRKKNLKNYWLFKGTNILHFSNKIVPELYWRKMNKFGEFDLRLPDIYACLQDISSCDISFWEHAYDSQTVIESFEDVSSNDKGSFPKVQSSRICARGRSGNGENVTNTLGGKNGDRNGGGHSNEVTLRRIPEGGKILHNEVLNTTEKEGGNEQKSSNLLTLGKYLKKRSQSCKRKKSIYEELKRKGNNFTDIEFEDNSDEYSYTNNDDINSSHCSHNSSRSKKRTKKRTRGKNMNRKYLVGDFINRRKKNYDNSFKSEMRINVIRNNDNYLSSNDEEENNYTNINYSVSSKNFDILSNQLHELSDNESSYSDKVCESRKIRNLNAFNYDKISIKNYDRLINKMNYREFKRTRTQKENFTVIDNIVDNYNDKETFNPKYNLRLIEHATDLPKTLSDNLLIRGNNVVNEKSNNEDVRSNAVAPSEKSKKKKKNFLNFLSDHNEDEEEKKKEKKVNKQERHLDNEYRMKSINYDNITKEDENLLNDYKDMKKIAEGTNGASTLVSNLQKGVNELLMSDNFIIKIQNTSNGAKNENVDIQNGEAQTDEEEKRREVKTEGEERKEMHSNYLNNEKNCVGNMIVTNETDDKRDEGNFDEYLTYQNLFALDNNEKKISSFFNHNFDKNEYLRNNLKNTSEVNISTKGTNSKSLALMNNQIEKRKGVKNKDKSSCLMCRSGFHLPLCTLRKKDIHSKSKTNANAKTKGKEDSKHVMANYGNSNGNIGKNVGRNGDNDACIDIDNNDDALDGERGASKLQRNNTTDFIPLRYDTDQTINFECIEDVCQKKHTTFYSFLRRPRLKIKNKLFSEIRRARSHESYGNNKDKSGKLKDDVFYSSLKKKIVRKEREGELYIMIFNTCRELYKKLYVNGFISGECLLTLTSILDLSADFALKKVRMNPIKAWADAFDKNKNKKKKKKKRRRSIDHRNGFEYEFNVLLSKLKINKKYSFFISPKVVNIFLVYEHCMNDLQIILSYVDVHQCTLDKGGITMKLLLGKNLLRSYYRNIELAKSLIPHLVTKYKDVVKYCLIKIGADMLMHLKKTIVNEQATNGLLLTQDNEKLNGIFDEQQIKINRYRPYLHYFLKKNILKMFFK
ncbi:sodium/hydrogen exchanger, Na+, H+ antiporter, putative [Plasmodium ovale]|nr:sodium/hydrogen exchanger, Na+, H+ antiporter, putative [Plasmodium ovale]